MADVQVVLTGVDNATGVINAVSAAFSGNLTAAIDLAAKALSAITEQFTGFLQSSIQGENITTAFNFALQKQGDTAVITAAHGQALAESMRNLAGGNSETVLSAESVLLKFHEINSQTFPSALKLSADLAAQMGIDMPAAAQMLGKGLENPTTAMRLLKQVGGEVTPEFAKLIKHAVELGDTADADSAIINKLNEVIGGKAANAASTLSGEWNVMTGNLAELGRKIGDDFLPVLHTLFDAVVTPGIKIIEAWGEKMAVVLSVFKSGDLLAGITNLWTDLLIAVPVLQRVQGAFFQVVDFVQKNWPLVQATAKAVWNDITRIFGDVGNEIKNVLLPAISSIWTTTGIHLPKAQSIFEGAMAVIAQVMRGAVVVIETQVLPTITKMVNWVTEHWPEIKRIGEEVFSRVGYVLGELGMIFDRVTGGIQGKTAIFKDIMTGNWKDIGVQLQKIWDENWVTIHHILTLALEQTVIAIKGVDWKGTGSAIMKQFIQGVEDQAYNVVSAIFGAPYRAWQALAGQFGVSSGGMNVNLNSIARSY